MQSRAVWLSLIEVARPIEMMRFSCFEVISLWTPVKQGRQCSIR